MYQPPILTQIQAEMPSVSSEPSSSSISSDFRPPARDFSSGNPSFACLYAMQTQKFEACADTARPKAFLISIVDLLITMRWECPISPSLRVSSFTLLPPPPPGSGPGPGPGPSHYGKTHVSICQKPRSGVQGPILIVNGRYDTYQHRSACSSSVISVIIPTNRIMIGSIISCHTYMYSPNKG